MIGSSQPAFLHPIIERVAESAWLLRFADHLDIDVNAGVHCLRTRLISEHLPHLHDLVPSYASLLLSGDERAADLPIDRGLGVPIPWREALSRALDALPRESETCTDAIFTLHRLPVCYGGGFGIDLPTVSERLGLSPEEIVRRHCSVEYRVALLGFAPGFAYLLGLDPALRVPRRERPRLQVPPGSIGLAGAQTGIYPSLLPGGWQLIGRTPARLLDLSNPNRPCRLMPGDRVRFEPIDAGHFEARADHSA